MKYKVMKYKVLIEQLKWAVGDIVEMNEKAATEALAIEAVELYDGPDDAKHVWLMVDPLSLTAVTKN